MESIKELRKICQKPSDCHNFESYLDNKIWRVFSIYLTKILLYTPLKPNHVTMFLISWGFIVGLLFSFGTYNYLLAGAIVLQLLWLIDCVDGEMARYKKMSSLRGVFLDIIVHFTSMALPFVGLTIGIYRTNPNIYIILAGLSASVFSVLCHSIQPLKHHVFFSELIKKANSSEEIYHKKIKKEAKKPSKKSQIVKIGKLFNALHDQVYMLPIILISAIFSKLDLLLIFYGITFPIIWLLKLIYEYRTGFKAYEYLLEPYKK